MSDKAVHKMNGLRMVGGIQREITNKLTGELLKKIDIDERVSQRQLARALGIALGLTNAYVKRCVSKGWVKVKHMPPGRVAYYLTPEGFAEKSRLTAEFLTQSLIFFRQARAQCSELVHEATERGWKNIGLVGAGDLAEIAILCAVEQQLPVAVVIDARTSGRPLVGVPVVKKAEDVTTAVSGWMLTGLAGPQNIYDTLPPNIDRKQVLVPPLLSVNR